MSEKTWSTEELWGIFTMEEHRGKVFDGMYGRRAGGRDLGDPIVSRQALDTGPLPAYPEGRRFAVCLTHDIDDLYPPLTHKLLATPYLAARLRARGLLDLWWPRRGGENRSPYRNFRRIMAIEESFGARSSFYFLLADRDIKRFRYRTDEVEADIGDIADRGWEVGLHGGYYAYDRPDLIREEKRRLDRVLGRPSVGYRNHYLMFRVPETWEHLAAAGFRYDTTIGYNDVIGFASGACHPYRPYDARSGRWIDILELPLAIMDGGLCDSYRSPAAAFEAAKLVLRRVEDLGGVATLLWHNSTFDCPFRADREKLYGKILGYCRDRGAWMASGDEICDWWMGQRRPEQPLMAAPAATEK